MAIAQFYGLAAHDGKVGIVDIGSNSVRLVVYDSMKRAPLPVFNEKAFCELGKGLAQTGKLNAQGVVMARECIARFLAMAKIMDVVELYILATAAVRDATDGADFVRELETAHGISVQIISGKEEARLAALGIISTMHRPRGLVGDLGGGSFELVRVEENRIFEQDTLPLGALRLQVDSGESISAAQDKVHQELSKLPWLKEHVFDTFYAIGGSFRSFAHAFLLREGYPLEVLHSYEVEAEPLTLFLRELSLMSAEQINELPGLSKKRAHSLPFAAVALAELIAHCHIKKVVFSTAGIREGFLFDRLSPYLKREDGMIAACVDLANQGGKLEGYARELFLWMDALFPRESERERRLRFAACILTEFGWRIHPQYRSEWMFFRIIQSNIICMDHEERVMLANALYHRHSLKTPLKTKVLKLLSAKEKKWCQVMGAALSLGFNLSGGMMGVLPRTEWGDKGGKWTLSAPDELSSLFTEGVEKKIEQLTDMQKQWHKSG